MVEGLLKGLNPDRMDSHVVVRLTRLWESRNTKTDETISIDMILLDREGTQIHAIIWKRQAERFREKLHEGKLYKIKNFRVVVSKVNYKPVDGKYTIVFMPNTSLEELPKDRGEPIDKHKFCFQSYEELVNRPNHHVVLSDVIGLLTGVGDIEPISTQGSMMEKLDLQLQLDGKFEIKITLWNDKAQSFMSLLKGTKEQPYIVIVTSTIVKIFNGQHYLSSTGATKFYINLDIPESKSLLESRGSKSVDLTMFAPNTTRLSIQDQMESNRKNIYELTSMLPPKNVNNIVVVTLCAEIVEVQNKLGWYYFSCENCKRKLEKSDNVYRCEPCHRDSVFPNTSYKVIVLVKDETGETTLTMFDREVQQLIGISAPQLISHYGFSIRDLPTQFDTLRGRTFIFQLKVNDFNFIYGKEDYTVMKIFDTNNNKMMDAENLIKVKIEHVDTLQGSTNSGDDAALVYKNDHQEDTLNLPATKMLAAEIVASGVDVSDHDEKKKAKHAIESSASKSEIHGVQVPLKKGKKHYDSDVKTYDKKKAKIGTD
ncbi:replication protein A 70 kDa DNA-binding subunit D-like [Tripterygium wilfordii]|uniref:replication protein A 70 kDa DNA-binding subunit D-like n=1 Tax=Tripterygium wilfordii TaxID=458696 RepID=UPI0018F81E85|nr:replication protein A 70 kDa DNA-binding subunit D-like [Tripterygium wilfordii]